MSHIKKIFQLIKNNLGKISLFFLSCVLFVFFIFPFNELEDQSTSYISKLTQGKIYFKFNEMSLGLSGVQFKKAQIEIAQMPELNVQNLGVYPSFLSLLKRPEEGKILIPEGRIQAEGLLGGSLNLSLSSGKKSEAGVERKKLQINSQNLSIEKILKFLNIRQPIKGQQNLKIEEGLVDFDFKEQPDIPFQAVTEKFELSATLFDSALGPISFGGLKLSSLDLKGRLSGGNFLIEESRVGKPGDEIDGTVKGNIALQISNQGGVMQYQFGAFSFDINLKVKKSFQEREKFLITVLNAAGVSTKDESLKFRASGTNFYSPPKFEILK